MVSVVVTTAVVVGTTVVVVVVTAVMVEGRLRSGATRKASHSPRIKWSERDPQDG